jgi:hypothetical protein
MYACGILRAIDLPMTKEVQMPGLEQIQAQMKKLQAQAEALMPAGDRDI